MRMKHRCARCTYKTLYKPIYSTSQDGLRVEGVPLWVCNTCGYRDLSEVATVVYFGALKRGNSTTPTKDYDSVAHMIAAESTV